MQNYIFSFPRFLSYSLYNLRMNWGLYLKLSVGFTLGYFIFTFASLVGNSNASQQQWTLIVMMSWGIMGIITMASAFPGFRSKEGTIGYLMIPASNIEKFAFEILIRIVGFTLLYYVVVTFVGNMAYKVVVFVKFFSGHGYGGEPFSWNLLQGNIKPAIMKLIYFGSIFVFSLFISGATIFMKGNFIKTLLFVAGVVGIVAYYVYLLVEKFRIKEPFFVHHLQKYVKGDEDAARLFSVVFIVATVWVLSYAFFKLKEKEV